MPPPAPPFAPPPTPAPADGAKPKPDEPRSSGGTYPGRRWLIALVAIAVVAVGVGAYLVATNNDDNEVTTDASSDGAAATGTSEAPTTAVSPTTAAAPTTGAPTTAVPPPLPTFGSGTKVVGTDIEPGRYFSQGTAGCTWARLRDLSGTPAAVIAGETPPAQSIVDIDPSDAAFQSDGCTPWIAFIAGDSLTTFGDGDWAVGVNVAPGRWTAPGGPGCTWTRTKDFSHTPDGVVRQDSPTGPASVNIAPRDVGFLTRGCGTWSRTR